jgi:hypothetical protein
MDDEPALALLDFQLMGKELCEILADGSKDPGVVVGRQAWFHFKCSESAQCNIRRYILHAELHGARATPVTTRRG